MRARQVAEEAAEVSNGETGMEKKAGGGPPPLLGAGRAGREMEIGVGTAR